MELEDMGDVFLGRDDSDSSPFCNNSTEKTNCTNQQPDWIALYDSTPEAIIVPCAFAIIFVVGMVGNTLLILSFTRHKTLSTLHNTLVVNLASGDFIFLTVSLPFNVVWYTLPYWPFGLIICKLSHFTENLATSVVISTLSVLSVERCLIVTGKKLWHQQKRGPLLLTLAIWAFSLLASLPNLITANVVNRVINYKSYMFCHLYDNGWEHGYSKVHVVCKFILLFCLPFLIISTAYIVLSVHLLLKGFPIRQRNVETDGQRRNTLLKLFEQLKNNENNSSLLPVASDKTNNSKQVNNVNKFGPCEGRLTNDKMYNMAGQVNKSLAEKQNKLKYSIKDESMAYSDSLSEVKVPQDTSSLSDGFVYTGPTQTNPANVCPKQEAHHSKFCENAATLNDKDFQGVHDSASLTSSSMLCQETTPLNPSSSREVTRGHQRQQTMVNKRRRLALTVLMLIVAFAVCWTPRHIYLLWFHLHPGNFDAFWHVFKIIGFCLSFSNSAVNPLVFYILDSTYRSFVHRALCVVCQNKFPLKRAAKSHVTVTLVEPDYRSTIVMTDIQCKDSVTEL